MDVTKRIRTENEILQLSRVVSQMADTVVITNIDGVMEYVNPAFEQLTGYSSAEALGKTPRLLKSDLHDAGFYERLWSTILHGEVFQDEVINRKKNGDLYYETRVITPIRDAKGKITHFVATGKDVTERKRVEKALRESEDRFRAVFESNNAIMLMMESDLGQIVDANPAAVAFYGYAREQLISMNIGEINQMPSDEVAVELQKAKAESRNYFIFPHRLANGEIRTVEVRTHTVKTKEQILLFSTIYDITERRKVEEALNESKLLFHLLIESLPQNIYAKDIEGRFIFANQHYCTTQGKALEEILGKTDFDHHPHELAEKYRADDQRVIETGKAIEVEEEHAILDGEKFYVQVIKTPLYDSKGKISGTLGIFWDITERKQSEELLRQQSNQLSVLYEASQRLNRTLNLNEIYQAICNFMSSIAPNDALVISAFDNETQLITCRAYWLKDKWLDVEPFPPIPLEAEGRGTQSLVIRTGQAMLINDYQARVKTAKTSYIVNSETNEVDDEPAPEEETIRSALIVPLKSGGRVTGVIQVMSYRLNAYNENQLQLLEALALHIVSAENNALLYAQVQDELNERKQAEEALRQSQLRFQALFELSPDAVMLIDPHDPDISWSIVDCNEAACLMNGYERDELVGHSIDIIDIATEGRTEFLKLLREAGNLKLEAFHRHKNGTIFLIEVSITLIKIGERELVIGIDRDITERKSAEKMLQESQSNLEELNRDLEMRVEERTLEVRRREETYRALFENANDAILLINPKGVILRVNERCSELLGYSADELIGRTGVDLIEGNEAEDAERRADQLLAGKRAPVFERRLIRKDGRQIEAELNLSLITHGDDQDKLIQCVVRDITERKKAQKELRESRDKLSNANLALEKASRLKDEFLASMSHELRTPLTSILGLSEVLQEQTYGTLSEKQLKSIKTIEDSGHHLLELINDILDLSKIEAGKLDMEFEPCSVGDICRASLQLVKGMAQQKNINIDFSMNPQSINMRADMRRMKQMLVNLLSNAVKFTPEKGKAGLEVEAVAEEKFIRFSVWDKGIGIKPEDMDKLFKPFTQLDSSLARQYSGTGLGLSLVQLMTEKHGGSIKVESTYGEGSRFTLTLPWSTGVTQPVPSIKLGDTGPVKDTLIVEDNHLDAEQITRYLKETGITSVVQPMMRGALEKAASLHPGVIVLDLNLPDGSGLDLLAQFKADQRTSSIPVIIASVEERRKEAVNLGAMGYLLKPFSQKELQTEVAKAAAFINPAKPVMVIAPRDSTPVVLVADDNEMVIELVSDFLKAKGFRVATASSGFELLELAEKVHADIMLVDIQMPGMDGMEAIRRIRAHNDPTIALTPIIAVTALAMSGDREKCLEAGANEYMSKPIVLKQLAERMTEFLTGKTG